MVITINKPYPITSVEGKTLGEYVSGMHALTGEAGVIGWSLGGPATAGALGLYGSELAGLCGYRKEAFSALEAHLMPPAMNVRARASAP